MDGLRTLTFTTLPNPDSLQTVGDYLLTPVRTLLGWREVTINPRGIYAEKDFEPEKLRFASIFLTAISIGIALSFNTFVLKGKGLGLLHATVKAVALLSGCTIGGIGLKYHSVREGTAAKGVYDFYRNWVKSFENSNVARPPLAEGVGAMRQAVSSAPLRKKLSEVIQGYTPLVCDPAAIFGNSIFAQDNLSLESQTYFKRVLNGRSMGWGMSNHQLFFCFRLLDQSKNGNLSPYSYLFAFCSGDSLTFKTIGYSTATAQENAEAMLLNEDYLAILLGISAENCGPIILKGYEGQICLAEKLERETLVNGRMVSTIILA